MATNFYFNNFQATGEQELLASLVMESIKIYGNDVYYIPFTTHTMDKIYGEDVNREYDQAIMLEMYIKSVDGFGGDGQFLSKFNLEVRDTITFSVAMRAFENEVGQLCSLDRPREGDLVWFVPSQRMFKITYVEKYPVFLQLGSTPFYDVKCEMFEHSGERFNTGLPFIDSIMDSYSIAMNVDALMIEGNIELTDEDGFTLLLEEYDLEVIDTSAENSLFQTEASNFLNFTDIDPFSEGTY